MTNQPAPARKYWAFLSYSHADKTWSDWLHRAIERYPVPANMIGRDTSRGEPVPGRLFPVFRDRDELPTAVDLGAVIGAALAQSRYLIVICSRRAARSPWVNQEILEFKKLGRENRILCVIVDGEPNASDGKPGFALDDECFPEAVRYRLGADGRLAAERTEPIAADARELGDGRANALLKLIAGLLGVGYDELKRRDEEYQRHRLRRTRAMVAAFAALAVWSAISAWQSAQRRIETQRTLAQSDVLRAEDFFARGEAPAALAHLVRAIESDPASSVAADRLAAALTQRAWPLPVSPALIHAGGISSVAFSADGAKVLTASKDGSARLWDARSGRPIGAPMRHAREVSGAAFSPGAGGQVLTVSHDARARLWAADTGEPVSAWLEHENVVNAYAFSAAGRWLATGGWNRRVYLWHGTDAASAGELPPQPGKVHTLHFDPRDENVLLTVAGSVARLWDVTERAPLAAFEHEHPVNDAAFIAAGGFVATVSDDHTARWWPRSGAGPPQEMWRSEESLEAIEISEDGRFLALRGGHVVMLCNADGTLLRPEPLRFHDLLACAKFSPDGERLLIAWGDGLAGVWSVRDGLPRGEPIREGSQIVDAAFDAAGRRAVVGTSRGVARVWLLPPVAPASSVLPLPEAAEAMSFAGGDRWLLTVAGREARVWDWRAGTPAAAPLVHAEAVLCATASPDLRWLVTGSADARVRVWTWPAGPLAAELPALDGTVAQLAFSPDGRWLAVAAESGAVQLRATTDWQTAGPERRHDGRVVACEFSRDSRTLLTAGWDHTARVWPVPPAVTPAVVLPHAVEVYAAVFNPEATLVATGDKSGLARIWDARSGQLRGQPLEHGGAVRCAGFAPDGRTLATGAEDGFGRLWDVATGTALPGTLRHDSPVLAVAFSADGRRVVTGSDDGMVRVWDATTLQAVSEPLAHSGTISAVRFSADGRWLLSAGRNKEVRVWEVATMTPATERARLAEFARELSPERLLKSGRVEHREPVAYDDLAKHFAFADGSGAAADVGRWFLTDPIRRTLSPHSPTSVADYAARREREENTAASDEAALLRGVLPFSGTEKNPERPPAPK